LTAQIEYQGADWFCWLHGFLECTNLMGCTV
jgi:hypothetical protein